MHVRRLRVADPHHADDAPGGYEQAGYSRELYHRWDDESKVTELQLPIR